MERLKNNLVYLSGAMDHSPDGGVSWRVDVARRLQDLKVRVLNPCDKPTLLEPKENPELRNEIHQLKTEGRFLEVQRIMKDVVRCDLRMVDIADFVILYITPDVHMCGSYHEMVVACLQRKPVLVVCDKVRIPNWIYGIIPLQHMFYNFDTMFTYLKYIHSCDNIDNMKRWHFFNHNEIFNKE